MLEEDIKQIVKRKKIDRYLVESTNNYYDHITFSITSLSEFVKIIESITTLKQYPNYYFFYRGMSNCIWELEPSLMRRMRILDTLEHDLAVEFNSEMPSVFKDSNSNFEKVASMQHYGIPTRLLDFSLNPLVALYFACSESFRKDGRVVFTNNKLNHFDNKCVECISSLFLYENCINITVDSWLEKFGISVYDYINEAYSDYLGCNPLFVKPPYIDYRMKNQRSVFLLFSNIIRDTFADRIYYDYNIMESIPKETYVENISEIYKEQIEFPKYSFLHDPSFILDKKSYSRIHDSYRDNEFSIGYNRIQASFKNRFLLQDLLKPLEMDDIWWDFSSIIIPAKYKKKILLQLNEVGINEGFIYPESEHVARIISKYY